jgi:hypothetical protein
VDNRYYRTDRSLPLFLLDIVRGNLHPLLILLEEPHSARENGTTTSHSRVVVPSCSSKRRNGVEHTLEPGGRRMSLWIVMEVRDDDDVTKREEGTSSYAVDTM